MKNEEELFRPLFIENLKKFKDEEIIKILCGVRRSGKSTILKMFREELLSMGVKQNNIVERLYSSMEYENGYNAAQMNVDLLNAIKSADKEEKIYLL